MSLTTVDEDLRDRGLARMLTLARTRFEALGGPRGQVTVASLTADEARAIRAIWKRSARRRPMPGQDFRCSLRDLDASLVENLGVTLEDALIRLSGELQLRPAERSEAAARSAEFWEQALAHPVCERGTAAREWVERLRQTGALGARPFESERGETLVPALDVALQLPREPAIERSTLASELLGDPHGLDDGSPIGDRLTGLLTALDGGSDARLTAGERRALLGRFGVLCDPASATVLTLGLHPVGESPLEQAMRALAGSHVVLTLGQLSRSRPRFERGLLVRLCENPAALLRAEDRLGAAAEPLICTGGWPGSAVCALLDALREADARFEHHGDFDWDGIAILRWLSERYGAQPWRFDRDALVASRAPLPALRPPRHRNPNTDPLVRALHEQGVAVAEETVLDELVRDLGPAVDAVGA